MANPSEVLRRIRLFLLSQEYDQQKKSEGVNDGHMILFWIEKALESPCVSEDGCCTEYAFKRIFNLLESGTYVFGEPLVSGESPWTRADTNAVLEAGGYPPMK